jgi:hypothetical protein
MRMSGSDVGRSQLRLIQCVLLLLLQSAFVAPSQVMTALLSIQVPLLIYQVVMCLHALSCLHDWGYDNESL